MKLGAGILNQQNISNQREALFGV